MRRHVLSAVWVVMYTSRFHARALSRLIAAVVVLAVLGVGGSTVVVAQVATTIIDSSGDGAGHPLAGARGLALDSAGNLYVAGATSDNVFKITPLGVITQIIDASGDGAGHLLDGPYSVAVDGAGNVFVAGLFSDNAFRITQAGLITEIIDASGDGAGHLLDGPYDVAADSDGNVYVVGSLSNNAFKISSGGMISEIIDSTGDGAGHPLGGPRGIALDAAGNVFVAGSGSDNAFRITPGGLITQIIDASGDGAGNVLDGPEDIAVDGLGNVYLTGMVSHRLFAIAPGGAITQIMDASGDGVCNSLQLPSGVAVNGVGDVYVAGSWSDNVFRITPDDAITQIMDSSGDGMGHLLQQPSSIAVDDGGTVYIAALVSDYVFKIYIGTITDCNLNGIPDSDDIASATSPDCNANGTPDECEIAVTSPAPGGPFFCRTCCDPDCNENGIPDACETDCNANDIPDDCDLASGASDDCNTDGVPDECQLDSSDCNGNSIPDSCDIAGGGSADCNANGVPDECEIERCYPPVVMQTVPVGNPGNAGEASGTAFPPEYGLERICGAVPYRYRIGTFEVTAKQYAEFLNSVAATDTYGLYDPYMDNDVNGCQITRHGTSGNYTYDFAGRPSGIESDWTDRPVNYVSWGSAARFCNWLHNGQPKGAQDLGTTEDGSYYLNGATTNADLMAVVREPGATWVIPSEDEWYKAAYHYNDGATGNYYDYPMRSDVAPSNLLSDPDPDPGNSANFRASSPNELTIGDPYYRTVVGAFENSPSAYGTYDQGGNVLEWTEEIIDLDGLNRLLRGGSYDLNVYALSADQRYYFWPPALLGYDVGFRVALVGPAQSDIPTLSAWGLCMLALLGLTTGTLVFRRRMLEPCRL